jgi:hypothetical protein
MRAAAGSDYFAIGVPDKEAIDKLAARLTEQSRWRDHGRSRKALPSQP